VNGTGFNRKEVILSSTEKIRFLENSVESQKEFKIWDCPKVM